LEKTDTLSLCNALVVGVPCFLATPLLEVKSKTFPWGNCDSFRGRI